MQPVAWGVDSTGRVARALTLTNRIQAFLTSVYYPRKRQNSCGSMRLWFHLNPSAPAPAPNKLRPSVPEEMFEGSRAKGKTTDYSVKLWDM